MHNLLENFALQLLDIFDLLVCDTLTTEETSVLADNAGWPG